ncbi:hypothetical protein PTSG_02869 [Salpingoeca rosetta]|uniref:Uncharacterized protein n=1 Tax=Salpingoeca rosetta (strain ATCC 50818 / BSB-021) TaxID=946362 RepID=F2U3K3_SALR5|nr:uncharacterized protein PTSG_02869 [Salpingoeca rosetta]EGD82197.1 hypothetical protein PTSG_02869 [Salpingoeca rosetta]|eukprot:XP_004996380.1 hypothetical protein PTSG_02869 [Salpingoeca rosetta]
MMKRRQPDMPCRPCRLPRRLQVLLLALLVVAAAAGSGAHASIHRRRRGPSWPSPPAAFKDVTSAIRRGWSTRPPNVPSQYFVEKKTTNDGGVLFVYTHSKGVGSAASVSSGASGSGNEGGHGDDSALPPCDVSAVISYRERIDPIHQIVQTRLRQKGVCHFHLVVVLWDVAWTKHQVEEYVRVLKTRPRTTLLIHRGSLTCYMCLRNMALPYIASSKYTLWADHGTLWKDKYVALCVCTSVCAPPPFRLGFQGDNYLRGFTPTDWAEPSFFLPRKTFIFLNKGAFGLCLFVCVRAFFFPPPGFLPIGAPHPNAANIHDPHRHHRRPHFDPGAHGPFFPPLSIPIFRRFGRQRQVAQVRGEGAFFFPVSGYEVSDFINFVWQWDPMTNIQHNHYTNARNGFLDLNYRCIHSDVTSRLSEMSMVERVPDEPQTHAALILAHLGLAFWHEFCFVSGADVSAATHPMQLPRDSVTSNFTCDRWLSLPEALGMQPFMPSSGIVFRSNFGILQSAPFNLTAADELRRIWDEPLKSLPWERVTKLAEGTVETKCLERRHAIAVISGLDPDKVPGHLRLLRNLRHLSSLVLEETVLANTIKDVTRTQLWILLKTRPLKQTPVPLRSFAALLDDVVEQVRAHNAQGSGRFLKVQYLSAEGDASEQHVLWTAGLKVRGVRHYRVTLQELEDALRPEW